jgi:hypothetical protein
LEPVSPLFRRFFVLRIFPLFIFTAVIEVAMPGDSVPYFRSTISPRRVNLKYIENLTYDVDSATKTPCSIPIPMVIFKPEAMSHLENDGF